MTITTYTIPTRIFIGPEASSQLSEILKKHQLRQPQIVTDRGVAALQTFQDLLSHLQSKGYKCAVFSDIAGNPVESNVTQGVQHYKQNQCDSLILIGGGAALDVGKAIGLMVNHPGTLFDYEDGKPDALPVNQPIPTIIAIPTTAGTGSEVGRSSVISDEITKTKRIIFDPQLLPSYVIADPLLSVDLPPFLTATTGIDALTHCVEAFLVPMKHPICDGIALEGVRLIHQALVIAVEDGQNLEAREKMLDAAMMGSIAFQKGLGVTHSCAHALSAVFNTHHGLANALMFSACLKFNAPSVPEKMARLAAAVGLSDHSAEAFIHWYEDLCKATQVKLGLNNYDISINDKLVDAALADGCHQSNPRPVTRQDFITLFEEALEWKKQS